MGPKFLPLDPNLQHLVLDFNRVHYINATAKEKNEPHRTDKSRTKEVG